MPEAIDPELAALIGLGNESGTAGPTRPSAVSTPDFDDLFGTEEVPAESPADTGAFGVDLTRDRIAEPNRLELDRPADYFSDAEFYKKVLAGEGEESQKLHELLAKYLKSTDIKERGVYRQQLIPAYWYLAAKVALHALSATSPLPKRLMVRFGTLLPTLLSPENRDTIQRVIFEKESEEPVYYVDEWLRAVSQGQIKASATDEVKTSAADPQAKINAALQKSQGKRDAAERIMRAKGEERKHLEIFLQAKAAEIAGTKDENPQPYTDGQRRAAAEIMETLKRLMLVDKTFSQSLAEFQEASAEYETARERLAAGETSTKTDFQAVAREFETIRQMSKLCIGRQGNHFPILAKEYFHGGTRDMGTRENVIKTLAWIEGIEPQAFFRPYRNSFNRIVPFIILLPCYGDLGICWEPFDRYNRAASRGRIAIPLYPKNLQIAVVTAIADLRWQIAKEKAGYHWMEEGLTGNYYQWFTSKKIKGDVKEYFIQDYIIWITKESEGTQKLDKEIRSMFWRYLPFHQSIKDKLKTRSLIYQELYQRDVNRTLSDGY